MIKARTTQIQFVRPIASLLVILALFLPGPSSAQSKNPKFIRDAEIENIIRAYATPLFQSAGLNPRAIDVYLIQDKSLNAFVAGGANMFLHTGLLMSADEPLQVIGVIAHETGHIAAGHHVGRSDEIRNAGLRGLAAYLLGISAAIASGQPALGAAIISGGQDIALKGLLSYSRGQEQAADQAAVNLLKATRQSPRGMLDFTRKLSGQEVLLAASQDPYLRTHPLTRDRVGFLERALQESAYADEPASAEFIALHKRMRAKLIGFLEPVNKVLRSYPETDTSLEARYARAIAYYRDADLTRAVPLIDGLIAEQPEDPYFRELKGQMMFENGHISDALPAYRVAVRLSPEEPQLNLALARVELALDDPAMDKSALKHLDITLAHEPDNGFAWRQAAIAYGRGGNQGMTRLALAEAALAQGRAGEAREHAVRAQGLLASGSPSWLRAQDVEGLAARLAAKQKKR